MFEDLTHIQNYKEAIKEKCWAFFFMRGVEAYFAGYSQPVYDRNLRALDFYQEGKKYAKIYCIPGPMGSSRNHQELCRFFLEGGSEPYFNMWGKAGYEARIYYEKSYTKDKLTNKPKETEMSNTLYKVKANETYGFIAGKDSKGRVLLEVKGTGEIKAFTKDEIEEVTQYTIQLRSPNKLVNLISEEGIYNVGDVVLVKTSNGPVLMDVLYLNTKNKNISEEASNYILSVLYKVDPNTISQNTKAYNMDDED